MAFFGWFGTPDVEKLKGGWAVERLINATQYRKDSGVREAAARALGEIGDQRAVEPLGNRLKDSSESVRAAAAKALGQLAVLAVESLAQALKDEGKTVRWQAAVGLGNIRDIQSVQSLNLAFKDDGESVRETAAHALGQVAASAVKSLVAALKNDDTTVREQAVTELGSVCDIRTVGALIVAIRNGSGTVREIAGEALARIETHALEALMVALTDQDANVRLSAVAELGRLNDPRVFNALVKIYEDKQEWGGVRESALDGIWRLKSHWFPDIPGIEIVEQCVGQLVALYDESAKGEGFLAQSADAEPARQIGERLNELGGWDLMVLTHRRFRRQRPKAARNLELVWTGIGSWQG